MTPLRLPRRRRLVMEVVSVFPLSRGEMPCTPRVPLFEISGTPPPTGETLFIKGQCLIRHFRPPLQFARCASTCGNTPRPDFVSGPAGSCQSGGGNQSGREGHYFLSADHANAPVCTDWLLSSGLQPTPCSWDSPGRTEADSELAAEPTVPAKPAPSQRTHLT